jgi:NADPH-dependent glutamate synthase beta subunit-like oxidoreductase/NAD-dependent dihydropyrimidine dehydrogenase PreA subunit
MGTDKTNSYKTTWRGDFLMLISAHCKFINRISFFGGLCFGPIPEGSAWTKILKKLISAEECELGMHLTRTPISVEDYAKKTGRPEEEVGKMLWNMADHGAIFVHFVNGKRYYRLAPFIPGIYEYLIDSRTLDKEMAELFVEAPGEVAWLVRNLSPADGGLMRVVPVMQEVVAQQKVLSHEDVMTFINNTDMYSVADCLCRRAAKMLGKGCEHPIEATCLQLGPTAEFYEKTGRGRRISKEEAIDVLDKVERAGLVHTVFTTEGDGESSYVCNCCGCSCSGFKVIMKYSGGAFSSSNFRAKIDDEKCVACGSCVDICPVNAIKLGDGLCKPQEDQIGKFETSRDRMWGKDKCVENYQARTIVTDKGTAPCKTKCPAHISVQGYIQKAAEGKYTEALEVIKKDNPFPAVCGRICPHPCEDECTRGAVDESLAIDAVKMFIADQDLDANARFVPKIKSDFDPIEKAGKKVAVVGSGPAGLSCAYYLAVEGYQVTVFEKQKVLGGMLTLGIPSFRLDKDVINAEIDILKELGIEFKTGVEIGKDTTITNLRKEGYGAFYIAIGAQKGSSLGIEGEEQDGVINGIDFLCNVNTDSSVKIDGPAVVVGGGNVAIDVARAAVREGAQSVNLYCLESAEEMPALQEEQQEAKEEGIIFNNGWGPKRIIAENGKVTGVEFKKCVSVFDNGKFAPKYDENVTIMVKADKVLLSIGQVIDWGSLDKDEKFVLDERKRIQVVDISYQTAVSDVFAGGDVVTGPKFAIDAIALGKQGAQSIHRYLQGRNLFLGREREFKALDKTNLDTSGYDHIPRQKTGVVDSSAAKVTFADLRKGLTEEQVRKEVERCLHCGLSIVDQRKCVGCGVCTRQCDFDAIHLDRISDSAPSGTWGKFYAKAVAYAVARTGRIALHTVKQALSGN